MSSLAGKKRSSTSLTSNTTNNTETEEDLTSLFECPVCFEYVLPPIYQCEAGHLVCTECRPKLGNCPTCRGGLGRNIRNLALEKVANTIQFPCKFASRGCQLTLRHAAKPAHEELCSFKPFCCPCPGTSCKWQGAVDEILVHLNASHSSITTLNGEGIVFLATDIGLHGSVDWVMMQACFKHNFLLVLEKQDKFGFINFYVSIQIIGTKKQAQRFGYKIELNASNRHLTWESVPKSVQERGSGASISHHDCLMFDENVAKLFTDDKGNLAINVTVSQK